MKRYILLLLSLLMMLILIAPAGVMGQEDSAEVTLFVTEDHAYSVALIDGWAAEGNHSDGLTVANSEEALAKFNTDEDPSPGEFAIAVLAFDAETMMLLGMEVDASAVEILETLLPLILEDSDEPVEASEVEEIDLAGREAAAVVINSDTIEGMYIVYEIAPDTLGVGIVAGALGTLDEMGELALEILATARYSPVLEEHFEDDAIAFFYPADWVAEGEGGLYTVTNDPEAMEADELSEGQFGIILLDLGVLGVSGEDISEIASGLAGELADEETDVYSEPIEVEVADATVAIIDVTTPDADANEGGLMVVQRGDDLFAVVFAAPDGDSYQIGLIALNVLLSAQ